MITDRAKFVYIKKLQCIVGYKLPDGAFNPINLELINRNLKFDRLDMGTRDQLLRFWNDFLKCDCKESPLCGCPERKFVINLLELRELGLTHKEIHEHLVDEYGIYMYPADILNFLEESVHILETIQKVSELTGNKKMLNSSKMHINKISR